MFYPHVEVDVILLLSLTLTRLELLERLHRRLDSLQTSIERTAVDPARLRRERGTAQVRGEFVRLADAGDRQGRVDWDSGRRGVDVVVYPRFEIYGPV